MLAEAWQNRKVFHKLLKVGRRLWNLQLQRVPQGWANDSQGSVPCCLTDSWNEQSLWMISVTELRYKDSDCPRSTLDLRCSGFCELTSLENGFPCKALGKKSPYNFLQAFGGFDFILVKPGARAVLQLPRGRGKKTK